MLTDPPEGPASLAELKRPFYSDFDMTTFRENVNAFWSLDLSDRAEDILEAMMQTVRIGEDWVFPFSWDEYLPGTDFWRVRQVTSEQLRAGLSVSDLWEAPRELVPMGRLNLPNESLVYTCLGNPVGPMMEAGLKAGDTFIMIWYRLLEPIVFKRVGMTNPDPGLTDQEQRIEEALSAFTRDVLAIPAEKHGTRIYALTQQVLQQFYPLDSNWETGWTYESTLSPRLLNAAIEVEPAHLKLAVNSVIAGRVESVDQTGVSAYYRAHSDGLKRFGDKIGFAYFPKYGPQTLESIIEWSRPRRQGGFLNKWRHRRPTAK
jgi:hypothetical protein